MTFHRIPLLKHMAGRAHLRKLQPEREDPREHGRPARVGVGLAAKASLQTGETPVLPALGNFRRCVSAGREHLRKLQPEREDPREHGRPAREGVGVAAKASLQTGETPVLPALGNFRRCVSAGIVLSLVTAPMVPAEAKDHLPADLAFYPLNYAEAGSVKAGQFLNAGAKETMDAVAVLNFPTWTAQTNLGESVPVSTEGLFPSDGMAIRLGLGQGFVFLPPEEGGPDLGADHWAIFARLYYSSGGDLRVTQPGTVEIRWFTDTDMQPPVEKFVVTVSLGGGQQVFESVIKGVNQWHDFFVQHRGGILQCSVDGAVTLEKALDGTWDKPTGGLKIENRLDHDEFLESFAIFPTGVNQDLLPD
jgi:hypothetical protein